MRYFIEFSYRGTNYCGWQKQPNGVGVQEVLEDAMRTVLRCDVQLTAAGRTDAGVHARGMVAHFDVEREIEDGGRLCKNLNSLLPRDIAVRSVKKVADEAHARFDALWRRYEYHIVLGKDVFAEGMAAQMFIAPDVNRMNEAAKVLFDYVDFTSFSKLHTDVKTNDCKIMLAEWVASEDGRRLVFTVQANRFLRNMVRAIVGTLLDVGVGKISIREFAEIIERKDRCAAGHSVPACGLYFIEAGY